MAENKELEAQAAPEANVIGEETVKEALVAENAELVEAAEADAESDIKKEKAPKKTKKEGESKEFAPAVRNEDFDWDAYVDDLGVYSENKDAIAAKYDKTLSNVQVGEVVEGTVIGINKREVVVNIGYKSEGIIPVSEFRYNPDLAIGEKVEVYVESAEDKKGQLLLSHKKARQLKSWDRVNLALENDEIIKGYIKCRTKGGMIVAVFGIEAFLPGSTIDVKHLRAYELYVAKPMEFHDG